MSCVEREELLNGMLDGQLAGDAHRALETHLLDCPGCRARLEALQAQHRDLEAAFAPAKADVAGLADRIAAEFQPPKNQKTLPWGWIAAAAVLLVALLIPRPAPPPPEKVVVKVVDPREQAAWTALEDVHAYAHKNPADHAGFAARCTSMAEKHAGTAASEAARKALAEGYLHTCKTLGEPPAVEELKKALAEAVAKSKALEETERELVALDEALNGPAAREQYAEARRLLEEAKARKGEPAWTAAVERRRSLLDARIAAQSEACVAAARTGNPRTHRERVAAWGIPDALARFDRDVGPLPEPKAPVPAPALVAAKKVRMLAVIGNLLIKGPEAKSGDFMPLPVHLFPQAGALCSLETEAGDILRLNARGQLSLEMDGKMSLAEGELFVMSKGDVEISCGAHKVSAGAAVFEVSSRSTAGQVKGPGRTVLRVTVLRGEVKIDGRVVTPGLLCQAVDGRLEPNGPAEDTVLSTQWMHPLLRGRREDVGELLQRGRALAGLLDDPKAAKAAETALRTLGEDAAPGLLSLLTQGKGVDGPLRKKLAALLGDLAGPESVAELVDLLHDHEPAVRVEASRGLERITGLTHGHPRTLWSGAGFARGAQSWETWLERNGSLWGETRPTK